MDRTVSRRSEPSSRTALMGEQPNPWDVLPPQDAMSRHRNYVNKTIQKDFALKMNLQIPNYLQYLRLAR
jgi:hypothetical protein